MEVNLYDFDQTIYDGDSTIDFYFFCLRKKITILKYLPIFFIYAILYLFRQKTKEQMKEKFLLFLNSFDNIDSIIEEFWQKKEKKIKRFYKEKDHKKDIIISASPEFLLYPIAKKLKVKKLIATKINKKTGKLIGNNCQGKEKVNRLQKYNKHLIINEVYSDNYKDIPILLLGKSSYLVKKDNITKVEDISLEEHRSIKDKLKIFIYTISNTMIPLLLISNSDYTIKKTVLLLFLTLTISIVIYCLIVEDYIKKIDKKTFIISLFISLYIISTISEYSYLGPSNITTILINYLNIFVNVNKIKLLINILSIPSISIYIYILIKKILPYIKKEYKSLTNLEKKMILIAFIIGTISTIIIYDHTNAFYYPVYKNGEFGGDAVIYSSDSGVLNSTAVYTKISAYENDIRQPLFGLFAIPFAILAKFISSFFAFYPNSYYIIFNATQIFLLILSIIMLSRMVCKSPKEQVLFFILSTSSYSVILFSFLYEQYIISLFYLILMIYIWYKYNLNTNYSYIAAVGTLSTTGILLPMIVSKKIKSNKKIIISIFKVFLVFLAIMIITGQIITISPKRFEYLMSFTGKKISFDQKLKQFLYFVRTLIIAPNSHKIVINNKYLCYRLPDINNYSIIGISILSLCIFSFIKNRKKIMAKVSIMWIIFSLIILCIIGWGTQENGLILYSLYFFWAYISLLFLLINNIKNKKIRVIIYILIISILVFYNTQEFINLLKFCITYYKA